MHILSFNIVRLTLPIFCFWEFSGVYNIQTLDLSFLGLRVPHGQPKFCLKMMLINGCFLPLNGSTSAFSKVCQNYGISPGALVFPTFPSPAFRGSWVPDSNPLSPACHCCCQSRLMRVSLPNCVGPSCKVEKYCHRQ